MIAMILVSFYLFSYTFYSQDSLYQASVEFNGATELTAAVFTLFDNDGTVIYTKYDIDAHAFYISNTGAVFAVGRHNLYLYRIDGEEVLLKELDCPNRFGFSPDNFLFFVSDKDGIAAYSEQGDVVYAFRPGRLFASTELGELVAIISVDTLLLYEHGVQKFEVTLTTPYARSVAFSNENSTIVVEVPTDTLIFDVRTGERVDE